MLILSFTQHACFLSVNTCAQRREAGGRKGGREAGSVGGREERERMIERARKGRREIEMQANRSRREERVLKKSTKETVLIEMQARRSGREEREHTCIVLIHSLTFYSSVNAG